MSDAGLIPISEQAVIAAAPAEVWPLLSDPYTVIACVPGAAITAQRADDLYDALITVRFGPTVAKFAGEVAVKYDHAARHCQVEGRGIDQRGASHARVVLNVGVTGETQTTLSIEGGFGIAGPLQVFASAGGVHVARALLADFAGNLVAKLEVKRAMGITAQRTGSEPAAHPEPVAELRAGRVLWQALASRARRILRGSRK